MHEYLSCIYYLNIIPSDTEAPTVICPTNQTIETDFNKSTAMVVWSHPVSADNSKLTTNVSCNAENGSQFEIGATEVMCHAQDKAGNLATCSFIVDVVGKRCTSVYDYKNKHVNSAHSCGLLKKSMKTRKILKRVTDVAGNTVTLLARL